jgi:hypothetical protein
MASIFFIRLFSAPTFCRLLFWALVERSASLATPMPRSLRKIHGSRQAADFKGDSTANAKSGVDPARLNVVAKCAHQKLFANRFGQITQPQIPGALSSVGGCFVGGDAALRLSCQPVGNR